VEPATPRQAAAIRAFQGARRVSNRVPVIVGPLGPRAAAGCRSAPRSLGCSACSTDAGGRAPEFAVGQYDRPPQGRTATAFGDYEGQAKRSGKRTAGSLQRDFAVTVSFFDRKQTQAA